MGRPRGSGAFLSETAVRILHAEHVAGATLLSIAERHWQAWGYKNANSALGSLGRQFRDRGLPIRNHADAIRLGFARPGGRPETSGISHSRAPSREVRREFPERLRKMLGERDAAALRETLADNPALAELYAEQQKDEQLSHRVLTYALSLDAFAAEEDGEARLSDEGTLLSRSSRRGQITEAVWVPLVCALVDRRREIDAYSDAA